MITEAGIKAAAEWWADRVCKPVFHGLSDEERKDRSNDGYVMAEMMASLLAKPVDSQQREDFIKALSDAIREMNGECYKLQLFVDYHPTLMLADAADKAGIDHSNFPWKSGMHFHDDGKVTAWCGYGTQDVVIYEPPPEGE